MAALFTCKKKVVQIKSNDPHFLFKFTIDHILCTDWAILG